MSIVTDLTYSDMVIEILIALCILILGIGVGKGISYLLEKFSERLDLNKKIRPSFLGLIINIIRWSIYLVFLNWALVQLSFQDVGNVMARILLIIPSLVVSIILIVIGFIVARYLKDVVQETISKDSEFLAKYLFYFVIFISGLYSLRVALFTINEVVLNYLTVVFSTIFIVSIAIQSVLKNIRN